MHLHEETMQKTTRYTTRTIYIAASDVSVWRQVVRFCKTNEVSLSRFVADALRWYLERLTTREN